MSSRITLSEDEGISILRNYKLQRFQFNSLVTQIIHQEM